MLQLSEKTIQTIHHFMNMNRKITNEVELRMLATPNYERLFEILKIHTIKTHKKEPIINASKSEILCS